MSISTSKSEHAKLTEQDRELIMATQEGLPLVSDPWGERGRQLGMRAEDVLDRFQQMQNSGVIRRVAAVADRYRLGYRYHGMPVWDVSDSAISEMGQRV